MKGFSQTFEKIKQGDYGGALKQVQRQVKQVALDMTDLEVVVEEATNGEPWGPHGKLLARIAKESAVSEENFREVMGVLIDRIQGAWRKPKQWRQAYKSLLVLDYIIKNGPEAVVGELTHDESMDLFSDLEKFKYVDENLRDHGVNVRKRAKDIATLLMDPERLQEEREIAAKSKSKLVGYSKGESSSSQSSWATRKASYGGSYDGFSHGSSSPAQLYETDNKAAWGKPRTFTSGATLVRTKPSFSVPTGASQEQVQATETNEKASEESREGDLLGLVGETEEGAKDSSKSVLSPIPNPVKIQEEATHAATTQGGVSKGKTQRGKSKFLSQTKINPKIKNTLMGFSNAPVGNKVEQDLMTLTGEVQEASPKSPEESKLKVEQDLMSLAEDSSKPKVTSESWDAFGPAAGNISTGVGNNNSGQEWANFDQGSVGQMASNPPLGNALDPLLFSAPTVTVQGQAPGFSSGANTSTATTTGTWPLQQPQVGNSFPSVGMSSKGDPQKLGQKGLSTSDDPFKDLLG